MNKDSGGKLLYDTDFQNVNLSSYKIKVMCASNKTNVNFICTWALGGLVSLRVLDLSTHLET